MPHVMGKLVEVREFCNTIYANGQNFLLPSPGISSLKMTLSRW